MVLDAAYCFSIGVPCDAAQHLAGMSHKVAESLYENFKTVTAVAEYVICKQSCFEDSAWCIAQQNRCKVISGAFAYSRGIQRVTGIPKPKNHSEKALILESEHGTQADDDAKDDAPADARDDNDDSFEPVFHREGWW